MKLTPCKYSFSIEYDFKKRCWVGCCLMIQHTLWELIFDHNTYWILILSLQWYMETFIHLNYFASNILININMLYGSIIHPKGFLYKIRSITWAVISLCNMIFCCDSCSNVEIKERWMSGDAVSTNWNLTTLWSRFQFRLWHYDIYHDVRNAS